MIGSNRVHMAGAIAAALFCAACAAKQAERAPAEAESQSPASAADSATGVAVTERPVTGVEELVRTNNAFAFELYRANRTEQFAISPHAVGDSLAIVLAAADGASAEQVGSVLRVKLDESDLHDRFRQLHDVLRTRETSSNRDYNRGFRLRVSSAVWHADGIEPSTAFLQTATNQHFATIQPMDFGAKRDAAMTAINTHYSDATGGKIGEVLTALNPKANVIVTSTMQFDAPWSVPFERGRTTEAKIATSKGARTVPMMNGQLRAAYLDGDGFSLVELPYADGLVSAWIVLPDEGNDLFDATLTVDFFDWMVSSARQHDVKVSLPRFELTTRSSFAPVLTTMGMGNVFDAQKAELPGFRTNGPVAIDEIVGVTRIKVDEDGSDAVATVRASLSAAGRELPHFEATRPFVFVVRDNPTGAILAMARVAEP